MISYLKLKNFRSIIDAEINFSSTRLNVLVGANGSGKSNLVRALDLIGEIQKGDLSSAIATQGGQRSIIPKAIPMKKINSVETQIGYRLELSRPDNYRENLSPPSASHEISFRTRTRNIITINKEIITFYQPLAVAEALSRDNNLKKKVYKKWSRGRDSSLKFIRDIKNDIAIEAKPQFSEANIGGYIHWFGFNFIENLGSQIEQKKDVLFLLNQIIKQSLMSSKKLGPSETLLRFGRGLFSFSTHASIFRDFAQDIKRFDFNVEKLRSDQQPTGEVQLGSLGENLPAAIRWLTKGEEQQIKWERVLLTLQDITPYVYNVRNNLLRSGKEYIEFLETKSGRPVESWDASDGALRSLAILIALESHPVGQTLVIEEPERGLHPWAIRFLFNHIRDAIERRKIQVIITTHSPQVLESVDPSEVFIINRSHNQGTKVVSVADTVSETVISPGDLGRLWVKGLIGGFPQDVEENADN